MRIAIAKRLALTVLILALLLALALLTVNDKRESGYVAFNAADYQAAQRHVKWTAMLGDERSQKLMARMTGLGLGGEVDIPEALMWMRKIASSAVTARTAIGIEAFYVGTEAAGGLYGEEKVKVGRLWLQIAAVSGVESAPR